MIRGYIYIQGNEDTGKQEYRNTKIQGYRDKEIQGYIDTGMQGGEELRKERNEVSIGENKTLYK